MENKDLAKENKKDHEDGELLEDQSVMTENENSQKSEDIVKENISIAAFLESFKEDMADHVAQDRTLQHKELENRITDQHYDENEEKAKKELIMTDLNMEHLKNQGLVPTNFESRKNQNFRKNNYYQPKGKNVERIERYYGDIYEQGTSLHKNKRGSYRNYSDFDNPNDSTFMDNVVHKPPMPEMVENLGLNDFFCEVCDIRMNGTKSYQSHIQGTKHLKKLKKWQDGKSMSKYSVPLPSVQTEPPKSRIHLIEPRINIENKLSTFENPLIGVQFVIEYFFETDKTGEPKYACELCDKKCDTRSLQFHLESYAHRWSYIKLKYPRYADEIREYGAKKNTRNEAIEDYAAKIEAEEGYPRKIKTSIKVNSNKVLTMEDAVANQGNSHLKDIRGIKVLPDVASTSHIRPTHQLDRVNDFLMKQHSGGKIGNHNSWQINSVNKHLRSNEEYSTSVNNASNHSGGITNPNALQAEPGFTKEITVEDQRDYQEFLKFKKFKNMETMESNMNTMPFNRLSSNINQTPFTQNNRLPPTDYQTYEDEESHYTENIPYNNNLMFRNQGIPQNVGYDPRFPSINNINMQRHPTIQPGISRMGYNFSNGTSLPSYKEPPRFLGAGAFQNRPPMTPAAMMNRLLSPISAQNTNSEMTKRIDSFILSLRKK